MAKQLAKWVLVPTENYSNSNWTFIEFNFPITKGTLSYFLKDAIEGDTQVTSGSAVQGVGTSNAKSKTKLFCQRLSKLVKLLYTHFKAISFLCIISSSKMLCTTSPVFLDYTANSHCFTVFVL